jgi:hypothetical protein
MLVYQRVVNHISGASLSPWVIAVHFKPRSSLQDELRVAQQDAEAAMVAFGRCEDEGSTEVLSMCRYIYIYRLSMI